MFRLGGGGGQGGCVRRIEVFVKIQKKIRGGGGGWVVCVGGLVRGFRLDGGSGRGGGSGGGGSAWWGGSGWM